MTDIRDREELRSLLEPTLGPEATMKLLEQYPPVAPTDLTTKDDLHELEGRLDGRFASIDRKFDAIDRKFEAIDRKFEAIDQRFEDMDRRFEDMDRRFERLETRMDRHEERTADRMETLEHRLLGAFRQELNTAMLSQARMHMWTTVGSVAAISGVALGIAFGA